MVKILNFIKNLSFVPIKDRALSSDAARQIDVSQLSIRAKLAPRIGLAGLVVAVALAWSFWARRQTLWLDIGFGGVFTTYIMLFVLAWLWARERRKSLNFRLFQVLFSLAAALIGSFWSIILVVALQGADAVQTNTLYALAIGLMSAPAFSGPALYALALWIPITIGSAVALVLDSAAPAIPSLIGLASYAFLTFTTILSVNAATIDREMRRVEAERQREVIGLLLRDFQEGTSDFLWETDAALDLVRPVRRFAEAASTSQTRLTGMSLIGFLTDHRVQREGAGAGVIARLVERIGRGEPFHEARVELKFGTETRCWALTGKPIVTQDGQFSGYRGVGSDVTTHRRAEQKIDHIARHDSLTGLANRMSFDSALETLCADPGLAGSALLCLDLDHFKSVNDRFGHQTGDALLVAAVQRILRCVRDQDRPFRLGGDEFAIILPETDHATAEAIAARIVARLGESFRIEAVNLTIGVCVGIAMVTVPGRNALDVHHAADLALYRAKAEGRGTHRSSGGSDPKGQMIRDVSQALNGTLDLTQFRVEYQPIVRLADRTLCAVEALIRWDHPHYGTLLPGAFIAEAEHSGAIVTLGRYVIDTACAFAATLPAEVAVAVNLSPVQLHDAALIETIIAALGRHALAPGRIEFELTETAILDMTLETVATLDAIKALGCRLSLDDFGSGYSSIASLYYFRFDRLKIDRTLIQNALDDIRRRTILHNITRLAREIGITVTGEGAETEQHLTLLRDLGFDDGQGTLFSAPLGGIALRDWVGRKQEGQGAPPPEPFQRRSPPPEPLAPPPPGHSLGPKAPDPLSFVGGLAARRAGAGMG